MTGRAILRLIQKPGRIEADHIKLQGENLLDLAETHMRSVRGQKISMIMQDPKFSLNPVMTIGNQIAEAFLLKGSSTKAEAWAKSVSMLEEFQFAIQSE